MGYFITPTGAYYEGDRAHALDVAVTQRPSIRHIWQNGAWALDATWLDRMAAIAVDAMDRLQFEHLFDLENTTRALKARFNVVSPGSFPPAEAAPITGPQYRAALINRWKAQNP